MEDLKLSLCITNYNRTTMLLESFAQVIEDSRIDEIIICDDGSNGETTMYLTNILLDRIPMFYWNKFKFRVHPRNNVGMYENKKRAIEYASNDWCILFDSDNILTPAYIDAFEEHNKGATFNSTIYCPEFAKPRFDYRKYSTMDNNCKFYDYTQVQKFIGEPMFNCLLNTCNYIVNKNCYLEVWEPYAEAGAADSIYFMYLWLKRGWDIHVVKDMQYEHRVHEGSGFMQDVKGNMEKAKEIKNLIKLLK